MDRTQVKEILGKQLQLLSEKSEADNVTPQELADLSVAIKEIAQCLVLLV